MRRLLTPGRLVLASAVLAVVVLFLAWVAPAGDYLYVPNAPKPLDGKVEVEGGKPPPEPGQISYVDVTIRQATWLERMLPFLRPDGSTLVAKNVVVPSGTSFGDRMEEGKAQMDRSERVAAAVALREAGYDVKAIPRGALIEGVDPTVPAAGVLDYGDVIVAAKGRRVRTPAQLRAAVGTVKPGDRIRLRVRRDGGLRNLEVRTIEDPQRPGRALIGIRIGQDARIDLPVKVTIDLGDVGGPSAGLPFALDVLEQLDKDVDRGYDVVATGEIELDGTIAPIGGVKQKAFAVGRSGADVFLVPGENAPEARRYAGKVRVIPVESFQQALHELQTLPHK